MHRTLPFFAVAGISLLAGCDSTDPGTATLAKPQGSGDGRFLPDQLEVSLPEGENQASVPIQARFVNQGTSTLEILEIKTSCACTMAGDISDKQLLPGAETRIPINVIPPPYGSKSATVTVVTSPPSPEARLLIQANGRIRQPPFVDEIPRLVNLVHTVGTPFRGVARLTCAETAGASPWLVPHGSSIRGTNGCRWI